MFLRKKAKGLYNITTKSHCLLNRRSVSDGARCSDFSAGWKLSKCVVFSVGLLAPTIDKIERP
jgi:hypothetical protein